MRQTIRFMVPGDTIAVNDASGWVLHTAVYFGFFLGIHWVIDCSPNRGVALRPLLQFSEGRDVFFIDYPNARSTEEILATAKQNLGKEYKLFSANCQHFTSFCATGEARSHQLDALLGIAALAAAVALVNRLAA